MASLKRQWTLQLQTDLASFRRAFGQVIVDAQTDRGIEYKAWGNTIGEDYFGELYTDTFYIYKRKGFIRPKYSTPPSIKGKITSHPEGLTLDISLPNQLNLSFIVAGIVLSFVLYIGITMLLGSLDLLPDNVPVYVIVLEIAAIFALMTYLEIKATHRYSDRMVQRFTEVIRAIEAKAIA